MVRDIAAYKLRQPPQRWTRRDFEIVWEREALMFGRDGIPAETALELFGGEAVARACNCPGTPKPFEIAGPCLYLTRRGAELAAGFCNVAICGDRYSADDLRRDLAKMGLSIPDPDGPTDQDEGRRQQETGATRRASVRPMARPGKPQTI